MTTDDERREVARKLREDAANDKLREQAFVEEIIAGCIGEQMYDEWGSVREVEILTRLADLIDPQERTCHILQAYGDESKELDRCMEEIASTPEDTVACICQSCGHEFRYERMVRPRYCPNCGARVIGGNDAD